ncbi:MAG: LuxR C-terminal-related transcriptional regulator [Demequina sp.]|uniref:helix-turn-helix transcriptional regulator n=1 Tax=Demequina sp. TaxID=2050685 RepID=UPI003A83FE42
MTTADQKVARRSSAWREVLRRGTRTPFADLAPLTVIALLPGWGASTWLRQAAQFLDRTEGVTVRRLSTRAAAVEALTQVAELDTPRAEALVIDGLIVGAHDPLWELIKDRLAAPAPPKVFIRSLDVPEGRDVESTTVLTEADLALPLAKIEGLARVNGAQVPPGLLEVLASRYRGNASIVRHRLERSSARGPESWPHADATLEVQLAADLGGRLIAAGADALERSTTLTVLWRALGMRRVDATLVAGDGIADDTARKAFHRLTLQPFGEVDVDPATGEATFEWHEAIWDLIDRRIPAEVRTAMRDHAVVAARREGNAAAELVTLLVQGKLAEADAVAFEHFRLLAEHAPAVLGQVLATFSLDSLRPYPSLLLCVGHLQLIQPTRSPGAYHQFLDAALDGFARVRPLTPFEVLRVTLRQAYAHVSRGDRDATARSLRLVDQLLGSEGDAGVIADAAVEPEIASRLAGELYLAMWSAGQVDDLDLCVRLADLTLEFRNRISPTASTDLHNAISARGFAGLETSVAGRTMGAALADPLVAMNSDDEEGALSLVDYMADISGYPPSCSAPDSLILGVRSLLAPERLDPTQRTEALEASLAFWSDGEPSTLVVASTTVALLAAGDAAGALRVARSTRRKDVFTATSEAIALLAVGRASDAAEIALEAERLARTPRGKAISGTLASLAQVRLGNLIAACHHLEGVAAAVGGDLTRFALRFATEDDFSDLEQEAPVSAPALVPILAAAATDSRPLRRTEVFSVTAVERTLLGLMREGHTYPEIAQRRFVSINTVRTQTKALLRKLGAEDRHEAVAIAERAGLFAGDA